MIHEWFFRRISHNIFQCEWLSHISFNSEKSYKYDCFCTHLSLYNLHNLWSDLLMSGRILIIIKVDRCTILLYDDVILTFTVTVHVIYFYKKEFFNSKYWWLWLYKISFFIQKINKLTKGQHKCESSIAPYFSSSVSQI